MRNWRILVLACVTVLSGTLLAVVFALVLPRGDVGASARDPLTGAVVAPGDPRTPTLAPARREPADIGFLRLRTIGAIRVEARAADPRGGLPWALRTFSAQRYVERRAGRGLLRVGKPQRCVQLGRVHDARFGWVDATNTFRPVGIGFRGAPISCETMRGGATPQIGVATLITDPAGGAARPLQAVVWGMAGAPASVRLDVDGRSIAVERSPNGALLAPLDPSPRRSQVRAAIRYRDGRLALVDRSYRGDARERRSIRVRMMSRRLNRELRAHMPLPALPPGGRAPQLEYRLPDPNGGLAWGVSVVPAKGGGWCTSGLAHVVGERVGQVDYELGTFTDAVLDLGCGRWRTEMLRRQPLDIQYGGFGGEADPAFGAPDHDARIVRRTLPGQTMIVGVARASVVSVTIATPRDVRTLTPSPRAHVFAAIYDGDFPTGRIDVSARLANGRIWRSRPFTMP